MNKILLILLCLALPAAQAGTLLVAAASDLAHTMDELGAGFSKQVAGARVRVSIGASGNFVAQITSGAPFDVFMSADMAYPRQLALLGAADAASLRPYALGKLAVWSLDPRFDLAQGMGVFADARLQRVAIANPDVAPYGRAARDALVRHGMWDGLRGKIVLGENVAQATQFVQTGNAQLGIVSLASVVSPRLKGVGRYFLVPDDAAPPLEQGAIVTRHGARNPLSARFMQFLQSPAARAILVRNGFGIPSGKDAGR